MSNWKFVEQNLPRCVFSRWIFGNCSYPKFTPADFQKSEKNFREMIIIKGGCNMGKTTAIVSVFAGLVHRLFPFQDICYDFKGGATIGETCDDFVAVLDVNSKKLKTKFRLGFWSTGDDISQNTIDDFERVLITDAKCDVIVCAASVTSEEPQNFNLLKKIGGEHKYTINEIHCLYASWLSTKLSVLCGF